ncbi:MAG: hypothetical protein U0176_17535 [Bacteroidia bacterium]
MKRFLQSFAATVLAGLVLVSCNADKVAPNKQNDTPKLSGAAGDPHPALDVICQTSDTIFLWREDNGSPRVDKCFGLGGVVVPCNTTQPKWGGLVIEEGYINNENVLDCNFWMAPGWYCDFNNWQFGLANTFTFDQNGIPVVNQDWSNLIVNPVQNKWQLRLSVGNMPTPSFDLALRVGAVRLNLFGAVTPGSNTTLWGRNGNFDKANHPAHSNSPWLMHFAPMRCMALPPVEPICTNVYSGPTLSTCTTITANTTGLSGTSFSYAWSTGATTASINVCPTTTTSYTVTISDPVGARRINEVTVNVTDAACGNGANAGQKVYVCHVPPGNPANVQEICIAPSGLPAHIARFRAPGSNPNQGHDSGCEIGRCGSNPCLNH